MQKEDSSKFKEIVLNVEEYDEFYLYTSNNSLTVVRTKEKKNKNNIIDTLIIDAVGESVYEYNVMVKTSNTDYACYDSDIVLCSKLAEKLKNDHFKEKIEKAIYDFFGENTLIFFTKNDHIRIFTSKLF